MTTIPRCMVLLALLACGTAWAQAPAPPPRYSLKQSDPDTGTNIRRDYYWGSKVRIDKKYAELTPEEQAWLKSQYEDMGPDDEPPYPVEGLAPIYKAIGVIHRKFMARGPLSLFVEVNSQGEATAVTVFQSPDPQVSKAVATVLMMEKYKPAVCKGVPCTMQFPVRTLMTVRH